jgi:two-component system chemotaxis response regulator CheY
MTEKRTSPRRKSFLRGIIYFDKDPISVECTVRNISETGARIKLANHLPRAGAFNLTIPISGKKYKGKIQWQLSDEIGVEFASNSTGVRTGDIKSESSFISKTINTEVSVLIVDDSRTMTLLIADMVRKLGFTDVDTANDGASALDQLGKKQYGLIFSDWEMQPMSGDELLKEIRQDKKCSKIPIILVSAKAGRGASWLAGASAFLPKPFTEDDLQTAIRRVFFLGS